ncbi:hypothetical protein JN085_14515 [Mycolicibacterium austroafricanum]|nr:hypothetical protein JN085_14515 [Mycolicibacterium austroafricanum]
MLGQSAKFVQLHPDSVKALRAGKKIPGSDGFYRMMTRGADGKFLQQLQWKSTALGPQRLMALQMVAVQIALTTAIAEVDESVRRVEGKVDELLRLAEANRAGDVLGNHTTISRTLAYLEKNGSLPDALWDSVATLGPALNVTVEQLRNYVTRTLQSFDSELPVKERAALLRRAAEESRLGDTLDLLIVTEESLYRWQRILLARVEDTEPEHLPQVIQEARELLANQLLEDGNLYQRAKQVLDTVGKPDAKEGYRIRPVRELAQHRTRLRGDLDNFARARRHQVLAWEEFKNPGIRDATSARVQAVKHNTGRALAAAGGGLIRISDYFADKPSEKEPADKDEPGSEEVT